MKSKRVTIYDIAQKVGVSHTTVARALGGRGEVSKERRELIQKVANELGYKPDPHLAALANYRRSISPIKFQGVIGWINHYVKHEQLRKFGEFDGYWRGAAETAKRLGFKLEEICWPLDCSPKRLENMLVARGVEGVLIPPHPAMFDWGDFDWNKFSVVRFGMSVQSPDSNSVSADQFRAVFMAVQRIHEYGYQRIGLVASEELNRKLGGGFLGGYTSVQSILELKPALPAMLTDYGCRDAAGMSRQKAKLKQWLKRHKPDAVLTTDCEIPGMIRELGYQIPQDIAVAGTSICDIPVDAGIDQHSVVIGQIAMEILAKQINFTERGAPKDPCRILVESRWQDGKSLPRRNQRVACNS